MSCTIDVMVYYPLVLPHSLLLVLFVLSCLLSCCILRPLCALPVCVVIHYLSQPSHMISYAIPSGLVEPWV